MTFLLIEINRIAGDKLLGSCMRIKEKKVRLILSRPDQFAFWNKHKAFLSAILAESGHTFEGVELKENDCKIEEWRIRERKI